MNSVNGNIETIAITVKIMSIKEFSKTLREFSDALDEFERNKFIKICNRINLIRLITRTKINMRLDRHEDQVKVNLKIKTSKNPTISRIQSILIKIIVNYFKDDMEIVQ